MIIVISNKGITFPWKKRSLRDNNNKPRYRIKIKKIKKNIFFINYKVVKRDSRRIFFDCFLQLFFIDFKCKLILGPIPTPTTIIPIQGAKNTQYAKYARLSLFIVKKV